MRHNRIYYKSLIGLSISLFIVLGSGKFIRTAHALTPGVTFTVNTAADNDDANIGDGICDTSDHHCSLNAALQEANSNNNSSQLDVIRFAITDLFGISPNTSLVLSEPVDIQGFTQSGALANTASVPSAFNGQLALEMSNQFLSSSEPYFEISSGGSGSRITGFSMDTNHGGAITLDHGASDVTIAGNYFGTDPFGSVKVLFPDSTDLPIIQLDTSSNVHIGGSSAADRNLFANCDGGCIYMTADATTSQSYIQGNTFGLGYDGVTELRGKYGVALDAGTNHVTVGGSQPQEGNIIENNDYSSVSLGLNTHNITISGNRLENDNDSIILSRGARDTTISNNVMVDGLHHGVWLTEDSGSHTPSSGFTITGNDIGVLGDGSTILDNNNSGVMIDGDSYNNIIGGTNPSDANVIAGNHHVGINIQRSGSVRNAILGNSIYGNNTDFGNNMGVTLGGGNRSTDLGDTDAGPNDYLNIPVNLFYQVVSGHTRLSYQLDVPAGDYRVEFFSNDQAGAQGKTFLSSQNVSSTGSGPQPHQINLNGAQSNITAIVTEINSSTPSGFGSSSEFSDPAVPALPDIGLTITETGSSHAKPGGHIGYTFAVDNDSSSTFDISTLDGSGDVLMTAFASAILPADLTPLNLNTTTGAVSTSDPNVGCFWYGPGSASFVTFLANHIDQSIMICAFTGSSTLLQPGESYGVDVDFGIDAHSELNFKTHGFTVGGSGEPDNNAFFTALNTTDLIDYFTQNPVNNFAESTPAAPVSDIGLTMALVDPNDVKAGKTIYYDVTMTNHGPEPFDLTIFSGAIVYGLFDIFIPPDLTMVASNTSDVTCQDLGANSIQMLGLAVRNHMDYNFEPCFYSGPSRLLNSGQSFVTRLQFTAKSSVRSSFTSYALNYYVGDPDGPAIVNAIYSDHDALDSLMVNNLAKEPYPRIDGLSDTGQNRWLWVILASMLTLSGVGLVVFRVQVNRGKK